MVKCDVEWVDHCYQHHYQTKCEKRQAFKPRMVSEPSKLNVTYFKAKQSIHYNIILNIAPEEIKRLRFCNTL